VAKAHAPCGEGLGAAAVFFKIRTMRVDQFKRLASNFELPTSRTCSAYYPGQRMLEPKRSGWGAQMNWGAYEVFSVLSGVAVLCVALLSSAWTGRDRFWGVCSGAFFVGYGIFVANQTSGFYVFPVVIFVIPVGFVIWGVLSLVGRVAPRSARNQPAGNQDDATTTSPQEGQDAGSRPDTGTSSSVSQGDRSSLRGERREVLAGRLLTAAAVVLVVHNLVVYDAVGFRPGSNAPIGRGYNGGFLAMLVILGLSLVFLSGTPLRLSLAASAAFGMVYVGVVLHDVLGQVYGTGTNIWIAIVSDVLALTGFALAAGVLLHDPEVGWPRKRKPSGLFALMTLTGAGLVAVSAVPNLYQIPGQTFTHSGQAPYYVKALNFGSEFTHSPWWFRTGSIWTGVAIIVVLIIGLWIRPPAASAGLAAGAVLFAVGAYIFPGVLVLRLGNAGALSGEMRLIGFYALPVLGVVALLATVVVALREPDAANDRATAQLAARRG
jgi:hypothetical protein